MYRQAEAFVPEAFVCERFFKKNDWRGSFFWILGIFFSKGLRGFVLTWKKRQEVT